MGELEVALLYRIQGYAGGKVEEDLALLEKEQKERMKIAIILRVGEKKIINLALKKLRLIMKLRYGYDSEAAAKPTDTQESEAEDDLVVTELEKATLDEMD